MKPTFEIGEAVRIVNASRLWAPDSTPIPIRMASCCLLGRPGRVVGYTKLKWPHGTPRTEWESDRWLIRVELLGRRSETRIVGMPAAPHLDSDALTELLSEKDALRRLPVIDALAALDA